MRHFSYTCLWGVISRKKSWKQVIKYSSEEYSAASVIVLAIDFGTRCEKYVLGFIQVEFAWGLPGWTWTQGKGMAKALSFPASECPEQEAWRILQPLLKNLSKVWEKTLNFPSHSPCLENSAQKLQTDRVTSIWKRITVQAMNQPEKDMLCFPSL